MFYTITNEANDAEKAFKDAQSAMDKVKNNNSANTNVGGNVNGSFASTVNDAISNGASKIASAIGFGSKESDTSAASESLVDTVNRIMDDYESEFEWVEVNETYL